ncbi:hypothetical protein Barb7_02403 [Bacteroidales bacterium Barb7]|nr:hypothetical protein Barb7_02403 [Bacteroidales bacterium Barb7]
MIQIQTIFAMQYITICILSSFQDTLFGTSPITPYSPLHVGLKSFALSGHLRNVSEINIIVRYGT